MADEGETIVKASIPHPLDDVKYNAETKRSRNPSGDACLVKSMSLPVEPMRCRALSTGSYPREQVIETNVSIFKAKEGVYLLFFDIIDYLQKVGSAEYNRAMLLIVGRSEVKIISPDAKLSIFAKHFRDIYQASQVGIKEQNIINSLLY